MTTYTSFGFISLYPVMKAFIAYGIAFPRRIKFFFQAPMFCFNAGSLLAFMKPDRVSAYITPTSVIVVARKAMFNIGYRFNTPVFYSTIGATTGTIMPTRPRFL